MAGFFYFGSGKPNPMLRRITITALLLLFGIAAIIAWMLFTSNTPFSQTSRYLYIHTGQANYPALLKTLRDSQLVRSPGLFNIVAKQMGLPEKIRPGRYEIKKGMGLFSIARMIRNGSQSPVDLVITKLRGREELAALVGRKFEVDSAMMMKYLNSADSLERYHLDSNTVMTAVFPDTYTYFWNIDAHGILKKLYNRYEAVWTPERKQLATDHGITPQEAYILASIIEEETNDNAEKGNIASVYLNRYKRGMPLQADPTIKFAMRDFSIRRIYEKYLFVESPYNTYRHPGLPPGPICTPTLTTLDAVLHSPQTNYLYFVARSDFSGHHVFSERYDDHLKNAKAFQEALNAREAKKDSLHGQ